MVESQRCATCLAPATYELVLRSADLKRLSVRACRAHLDASARDLPVMFRTEFDHA